jgi:hypothetical protein
MGLDKVRGYIIRKENLVIPRWQYAIIIWGVDEEIK